MQLNSCNLFLISKNHQALSLSLNDKMRLQTIGKYKIHGKGSIYKSHRYDKLDNKLKIF